MSIGSFAVSTIENQLGGISDAIIQDSCLLRYLRDNKRFFYNEGGATYGFRVKYQASSNGGFSGDWLPNNVSTQQPFKKLSVTPRQWVFNIISSKFQEQRNEKAGSEAQMFKQLAEDLNSMKQDAADHLATAAYGTTGTSQAEDVGTPISGLEDICDNDNTFAGQARTGNAWWQANVSTQTLANFHTDTGSTGRVDGIGWMISVYQDCSAGQDSSKGIGANLASRKDEPDFVLTTKTIFDDFDEAMFNSYRYQGNSSDPHKKLMFHGAKVDWDTYVTANRMYFLNKKYLRFNVVGSQLLEHMETVPSVSPVGTVHSIGGQGEFFTTNSRYLGVIQFS